VKGKNHIFGIKNVQNLYFVLELPEGLPNQGFGSGSGLDPDPQEGKKAH
jgi:hypothetical protein